MQHLQKLEDFWVRTVFSMNAFVRFACCLKTVSMQTCLQLNDNKIDDWKEVEKFASLNALETLYLERNPIYKQDPAGYRRKLMLALPQIKQIDAIVCR